MAEQVNTEATPPVETASSEDKLMAGLVADETPQVEEPAETPAEAPAEVPTEEAPTEDAPANDTETPEVVAEETPVEPAAAPAPVPGTPNKVLQRAQQEQSAIQRQLAEMRELIERQGRATPQQVAKVETLTEKAAVVADEIDGMLAEGYDPDPFNDQKKIVKKVKSQSDELRELREKVAALESVATEARTKTQAIEAESVWTKLEVKYQGVDVRSAYSEARAEAEALGYEGKALDLRANEIFHQKAAAGVQATPAPAETKPAPTPPKAQAKPAQTARKAPPVTPGGASVTVKSGAINRPAPVSDEAKLDSLAARLVV